MKHNKLFKILVIIIFILLGYVTSVYRNTEVVSNVSNFELWGTYIIAFILWFFFPEIEEFINKKFPIK